GDWSSDVCSSDLHRLTRSVPGSLLAACELQVHRAGAVGSLNRAARFDPYPGEDNPMFNPGAYENSRPDGHPVLEIVADPQAEEPGPPRFVPLRRTELAGEVTGPLAALRLTQLFGYTREQCDRVLEAVYRFPLPGDAAVTG